MTGNVAQISISTGGVPKTAIGSASLGLLGIAGDDHRNKKLHGGPQRALLLIAAECIDALKLEGWPLYYGALGENITTMGIDHRKWRSGQRFRLGSTVVELTTPRAPCVNLRVYGSGIEKRIYDAAVRAGNPNSPHWGESGFYASVHQTGRIETEDIIELLDQAV